MKLITISSFLAVTLFTSTFAVFASTGQPFYGDPPDAHPVSYTHLTLPTIYSV